MAIFDMMSFAMVATNRVHAGSGPMTSPMNTAVRQDVRSWVTMKPAHRSELTESRTELQRHSLGGQVDATGMATGRHPVNPRDFLDPFRSRSKLNLAATARENGARPL